MRKRTNIGRAMMPHGWPTPMQARIYTIKQLALRYALTLVIGAIMGGPAVLWVACKHFCNW